MCDLGRWETKVNERDKRITDLEREIVVLNICRKVEKGFLDLTQQRVERADALIQELATELRKYPEYDHIFSMADNYLFLRAGEDAGD